MNKTKMAGRAAATLVALTLLAAPRAPMAQTADRVLSEATIHDGDRCAVVGISLNFPVRLISAFPAGFGDEVRIRIAPIEGGEGAGINTVRESLRPPTSDLAGITKIEFEGDRPEGPTLTVTFEKPTHFQVAQGADFRSFILAISGDQANPECIPTQQRPLDVAAKPASGPLPTVGAPSTTPDAELGLADRALITDARAALTGGDNTRAIQVLTKLTEQPPGPATREARELLGIARERNGQAAHAKAEYQEYLRLYPEGADSDRVRQRLAALIATAGRPRQETATAAGRGQQRGEWKSGGSVSAFYMRDESYQQIDDTASSTTTVQADTNLNQILSTFDAFSAYSSADLKVKFRATGSYTGDFRPDAVNEEALSAFYVEAFDRDQRFYGRVGRQTRSTSGVLGRFDGALVSTRLSPTFKLEVVAGAPVDSSKDVYINSDRYFYGVSLAFGRFANAWDGDVYAIEQRSSGVIDRRAVGAEVRYVEKGRSVFGAVDYDVHFNQVNFALLNGSWTRPDGSAFTFAVDYRRSPLLFTSDALLGQTVRTLDDLRGLYSDREIRQLALDRSAEGRSATLGFSRPLTTKLSINVDATASDVSATPASGGAPATTASGTEYFYSAQLIGSGLIKEGDIGILGLRYADTATSNRWVVDVNTRYPVSRDLRINPRLRLGYRENKLDSGTEISARPSIRVNYASRRRLQYELEFGGEWLSADTPTGKETTNGYFVNFGVRRDF